MGRLTLGNFREAVAVHGWKLTPQRIAIVEYVSNALHHPTAEDICIHVNERFPMTSRATVYNTLHLLRDYGLLQEINEAGVIRFDPNIREHHHFICTGCGSVRDIPQELVSIVFSADATDFEPNDIEVVVRGRCVVCKSLGHVPVSAN